MKEGYFPSAQTFRGFRRGWRANHFPLRGDDVMTIHVALSRIGLRPEHSVRVRSGCDRYAIRMAFLSCGCHLQVSRDLGHSRVGSQVIFPNSSHGSGDAYSYSRQLAIFPSTSRTTKQPPRVSICQTQRTLGRRDVSFPNEASSVPPARTPLAHAFRRFLSDFWNQNCPTTWS